MGSWGYVAVGFALTAGTITAYVAGLERRMARLRPRRRGGRT